MSIAFNKNLKLLKIHSGLSSAEIAKRLKINLEAFKSYEFRQSIPSLETIKNLANLFEVSIDFLLFGSSNKFINHIKLFSFAEKSNNLPSMERNHIDDSIVQFIKNKSDSDFFIKFDDIKNYNFNQSIHENIKILRNKNNLTQDILAKLLGYTTRGTVWKFEQNLTPPVKTLSKLSLRFDFSVHYLITGDPLVFQVSDNILLKNLFIFDKIATLEDIKTILNLMQKILENNNIGIK